MGFGAAMGLDEVLTWVRDKAARDYVSVDYSELEPKILALDIKQKDHAFKKGFDTALSFASRQRQQRELENEMLKATVEIQKRFILHQFEEIKRLQYLARGKEVYRS